MANLSIRNLTPKHEQTLTNIRHKYGRGTNTASGAIAKALEDWERLQTTNAALKKKLNEAMDLVREYSNASLAAGAAMERERAALRKIHTLAKQHPVGNRELSIE